MVKFEKLQRARDSFVQKTAPARAWVSAHPLLILLIIFLLAFAVRSVPLRFEGSFDPDAHFHARMGGQIAATHELIAWDSLSLQGRVYSYPPLLHVLIGVLADITNLPAMDVLKYMGILIGALFTLSIFLLAYECSRSRSVALWSALFAGLSSIAVWRTAGFTRPDGLALTLIPFILYLWFTRREKTALVMSIALVLLHTLSSFIFALLLSLWFLLGLLTKRVSVPPLLPFALGGMLITVTLWFLSIGLPLSSYASHLSLDSSELVRFAALGFIVLFPFSWIFSFLGIARGKLPLLLVAWLALTLVIGMFGNRLAAYFIPFYSIAAGYGIHWLLLHLRGKKFTTPLLGFFLVILGMASVWMLMSGVAPFVSAGEHSTIDFLAAHSSPNQSVLTIWDRGHILSYYTGLPVVIDGYFEFGHEMDARNDAMHTAHNTSKCSTFLNAVDAFSAHYFFLAPPQMGRAKYGVLELERCPGVRVMYSGDGGKLYERIQQ